MRRTAVISAIFALAGLAAAPAAATGLATPDTSAAGQDVEVVDDPADASDPTGTAATGSDRTSPRPRAAGDELVGSFGLDAGQCGDGEGVTAGSSFRMLTPDGESYVDNSSSPCDDGTWTPLSPGTDGGFSTEGYQPHPDPPFSGGSTGDAQASKIMQPQAFHGTDFSVATEEVDAQTGDEVPVPSVVDDGGGTLSGDLSAWNAAWNGQFFNQGAPKPSGETPGQTELPSGTYDAASGAYTLEWKSLIEGGPFDGFTGVWHLEGTFEGSTSSTGAGGGSSTRSTTGPGGGTGSGAGDDTTAATTSGHAATGTAGGAPEARTAADSALPRTGGPLPGLLGGLAAAAGAFGLRLSTAGPDRRGRSGARGGPQGSSRGA